MLPFSVVLLQQIHCYTIGLLRYYGNATNSLLPNSNCHVTMETPQTHCHATATVTLLWKCHQGPNISHAIKDLICHNTNPLNVRTHCNYFP
jgi:hypothetical protein